jgi:hypothetical protein
LNFSKIRIAAGPSNCTFCYFNSGINFGRPCLETAQGAFEFLDYGFELVKKALLTVFHFLKSLGTLSRVVASKAGLEAEKRCFKSKKVAPVGAWL